MKAKMREKFGAKLLGNVTSLAREILFIITKFPYNAHSDWLKQRALSENTERVDDGKLSFKFLLRMILTNLTQIKHPL